MSRASGYFKQFKWKYILLLSIASSIILLDQITKYWVVQRFRLGESIPVIQEFFNLTYVQNRGAAFGLLAHAHPSFRVPFFIVVPVLALTSIAYVFRRIPDHDLKLATALSLVIAGAIGNLIDRFTAGFVVDFLDFHWHWSYHFPAFNVADSAICVGVGLIMLDLFNDDGEEEVEEEEEVEVKAKGKKLSKRTSR